MIINEIEGGDRRGKQCRENRERMEENDDNNDY